MRILIVLVLFFFPYLLSAQVYPKREMRAAWIATVTNVDWPSTPDLSVEKQQKEMVRMLDELKSYNLNTVVFQVRPASDAFYASPYEPWSQWLTGKQGRGPVPFYDPLDFVIKECRKRGMEIHVWFNPYRAVFGAGRTTTDPQHISNKHPEWFLSYGKNKYFDPGLPQTREYVTRIICDVVRRYDIDAVHLDDYFYPYKIPHVEFPDDNSFVQYPRGFSKEDKAAWRRDNVNLIIKQLHDSIKSIKPLVQFGVSPFGVWRNNYQDQNGSNTKAGTTNYDDLYADILKWQKNGWVDYVTPQLYWPIGKKIADYAVLSDWWSKNANGCQVFIGQAPYRIEKKAKEKAWKSSQELVRQINLNRSLPNIQGSMYFSAKYFLKNPLQMKQNLTSSVYRYPALPPEINPAKPIIPSLPANAFMKVENNQLKFTWNKNTNDKTYVLYCFKKNETPDFSDPSSIVAFTAETEYVLSLDKKHDPAEYNYILTALSPSNAESLPVNFEQKKAEERLITNIQEPSKTVR
ncbi:MAG: family 10 glycosylhydrolase [Bacteroidota bacterium]|nr:family 10 glycosylhydrolase [Bacteroidota bacterium]